MPDEIKVPDHLSIEGRGNMIADVAGALHPDPADRRKAVKAIAESHIRAAIDQAFRLAGVERA